MTVVSDMGQFLKLLFGLHHLVCHLNPKLFIVSLDFYVLAYYLEPLIY